MGDRAPWAELRDAWVRHTAVALTNDPRVVGWGLVGSFGRGEADPWSDVDLLVLVRDGDLDTCIDPDGNPLWATAQLVVDARRNAPVGATSVATLVVRSGLPIGADWYVYPSSMGAWPDDCDVRHGADAAPRTSATFAEWNGQGPRNLPVEITSDQEVQATVAMIPIAGKYLARRSPLTVGMLQMLGAPAVTDEPLAQLGALRGLVSETVSRCPAWLTSAVSEYLRIVALTIE